jgi:hypothetical protein
LILIFSGLEEKVSFVNCDRVVDGDYVENC